MAATSSGAGCQVPPSSRSDDQAVPAGVPVMITMPGFSVKLVEKKCTR
jgi:hypothetical protein